MVYNAANRAVSFTSRNGNTIIECGYDYQGRRYMKKVTQNGTVASHERYLYRGYLQIAALDMLDNRNVLRTLLWDPLEPVATRPLALVQGASLYCYGVDFNKNVSEVFDAQGTIAAAYRQKLRQRQQPEQQEQQSLLKEVKGIKDVQNYIAKNPRQKKRLEVVPVGI